MTFPTLLDENGKLSPDLTPAQIDEVEQMARAMLYATGTLEKFSAMGFECFYWGLFGRPLPRHVAEWVSEFFAAHTEGRRRFLVKAFRGATKSTVFTIVMALYYLAEYPDRSVLIIQKSDTAAAKTSAELGKIISNNPGWKTMCPNLVPDPAVKWGEDGYEITNKAYSREKWQEMVLKVRTKDNSFVALGWASGAIVGMHPHLLLTDDIHDEENTRSQREIDAVISTLKSNILQTLNRPPGDGFEPTVIVSYTPWTSYDSYAYLEGTGLYYTIATPLYAEVPEGTPGGFWYEEAGAKTTRRIFIRMAWDGIKKPIEYIEKKKLEQGARDFFRMSLLDLKGAESKTPLTYYPYTPDAIQANWPVVGGADPTNVFRESGEYKGSYFALAYIAKIPQGGAVVVGGELRQCSQIEAENLIAIAQTRFERWQFTAVENVGGGALFIQVMRRNPSLRVVDSDLSGIVKKQGRIHSKQDRFLLETAPWFANSVVRISSADTPFLNALRRLFTNFYSLDPKKSPEFDAGDAVYHALKAMPDVLHVLPVGATIATAMAHKREPNPMNFLGRA